ncbi:MAG: bifunctional homocysteine S-methyltransferase/methylenetetrahydrofolate reductase [Verrucomicrobia bacterium]|nr:MAG: bifunctional homocysteine S-methyltransferase/methylenetetrahydrofolate reductase [Verrucomicrobiota bacterium]
MDLLENLRNHILCGDGAMGTLLIERGVALNRCFEELNLHSPGTVRQIHEDYIRAGAQIIGTNSFAANSYKLSGFGLESRVHEINCRAAQLAKQSAKGCPVYVAGCVGPIGLSATEATERGFDREAFFREQIGALVDGGVDLIFFETFQDPEELALALRVKQSLHPCPTICSLACNESGRLSNGTSLGETFHFLLERGADIIGINCISGPHRALRLLELMPEGAPLAAYPNAGRPRYSEGRYLYEATPNYFAEQAIAMVAAGAGIIGGCCGTTPDHIAALSKAIEGLAPVRKKRIRIPQDLPSPKPAPLSEESILDQWSGGKRVILIELDPPKTLCLEKYFVAAGALKEAGGDVITLADNSLAILRVSNLAVGAMLKERGITPLLHLSCRDRNLIGLQSDLMGMAALGMRHVLPLTGDPAKAGDHPGASSVYDVNSVQLLEIIQQLNRGFTQSGRDLKRRCDFVAGCTFNPNAKNLDAQISRLERKIAAGAQYVMTQPIFSAKLAETIAIRTQHLNIPIFLGVWPLLNGRQARFLHNEVPGITIPDSTLARMEGLEGAEGRKVGVSIAREIAQEVLAHFSGIYLITPFLAYETTVELTQWIRAQYPQTSESMQLSCN